ncbi:fibronectin type III domain-containing protein [Nocardioides sp. ChNu-153]|uniref:Ig-like domain-containing protein n=1 Tax=unclassified Nocardioides TaxID=2615069 RepID=UPI002407732E|nr:MULTISPECIES: Ig-like domain-containing protein [unclassified Nocardioides]MDF9717698.1 fibronectin type III domain-containing protein [Nocardioides sp. ChNu-99]MDN7121441.1 fibronectin type III domain-containing protein [Nocardioides sp. ChNu-153]
MGTRRVGSVARGGRRRATLASTLALVVALVAFVVHAATADGFTTHEADLDDGGVWVTNDADSAWGRINKPVGQLDGALFGQVGAQLDVVQDGAAVIGVDTSAGVLSPIDPATVQHPEGEQAAFSPGAQVRLAGGTAAVLDPATGGLWAQRVDGGVYAPVAALDRQLDPGHVVEGGTRLAVSTTGTAWVLAPSSGTLTEVRVDAAGTADPRTVELDGAEDLGEDASLTVVGERPVVLDPGAERLLVPADDGTLEVELDDLAGDAVLQQPGPDASGVLVATGSGLREVPLGPEGSTTLLVEGASGAPTEPVRLGACRYGAWSGPDASVATRCDGGAGGDVVPLATAASDLVFRTNRGQVVLNDRSSGAVWDVDSDQPARLDNWDAFRQRVTDTDDAEEDEAEAEGDRRPPVANPDVVGARPGQTAVLHPLDNDTAPDGRLLAIRSVDAPVGNAVDLTISPDGQTVQVRLPEDAGPTTTFEYHIDDGRADVPAAHATVTVQTRRAGENNDPHPRAGYTPREWVVPAGGVLDVPVLPDWRDSLDSDPLTLTGTVVDADPTGTALARPTGSGRVRFEAGQSTGVQTVSYTVADGLGGSVTDELTFRVQDRTEREALPATAEPDVVAGEVGEVITIRPLGNDLPGSDPGTPDAELALAGPVTASGDARVETDLVGGTLSFRADRARTYFLDYDAAYGNAEPARGQVRVDVEAPQDPPAPPVAVPDQVTLHGQASSTVDVLGNDVDPRGGLLVVQAARARTADQLDVAVVEGRWLQVAARGASLSPNPQVVEYTVSNGAASVTGEVVVSQRPAPDDTAPVTQTDRLVVRSGAVATVPVLENDFSPAGDALALAPEAEGLPRGELAVVSADGTAEDPGRAFVSGAQVRYAAPAGLTDTLSTQVTYVATNAAGERAPGRVEVTVLPVEAANRPPAPPVLEGRTVAGERLLLRVPAGGVDPDGDPVTVTGIGAAPGLGRVLGFGADTIEYQAYPRSAGTDEFTYTVTDPYGEVATGRVRVAVVSPGETQPPLAVDDAVTVEPGRDLRVDVLANDLVAPGDRVDVTLVDPPPGVELGAEAGPLRVPAPERAGDVVEVVYEVSNGLSSSRATVRVRALTPYDNPPVVPDAYGEADSGPGVEVDVLVDAFDPDGDDEQLVVTDVFAPADVEASTDGRAVEVVRAAHPVVVGFRVEDGTGGAALASLFVPAASEGAPYVLDDALVEVDPGGSTTGELADLVADPAGGEVAFTLSDRVWASPAAQVSARVTGTGAFEVSAVAGYAGPAAVVAEVTTGTGVDDPEGVRAVVSIPVQVGESVPILSCPAAPVEVVQGEEVDLDVAARCHVWTADPDEGLSFDADWETSVDGLSVIEPSGPIITVAAAATARPGDEARLSLTSGASEPGVLTLRVVEAPRPTLAPVSVSDLRAGEERVVDLAPYLTVGVDDARPTILGVERTAGPDGVGAEADGDASVRITTADRVDGRAEFTVTMSDVPDGGPERQATGTISVEVLDRPDTPAAPVPVPGVRSQEVGLQWTAPEPNGAPVQTYEVAHAGGTQTCPATRCDITGLTNGEPYSFRVRAQNAVGWSEWSPTSAPATPDAPPGAVGEVRMVARGDRTVTLQWTEPTTQTSAIERYYVQWPGGQTQTTTPGVVVTGLDNSRAYQFTVSAENAYREGPAVRSAAFQSIGAPGAPGAPTVTDQRTPGDAGAVTLRWDPVAPNGPAPLLYTVRRDGTPLAQCTNQTTTSCDDAGLTYDGRTYSYDVVATNNGGADDAVSTAGAAASWTAVGRPAEWGAWTITPTGADGSARVQADVPGSRGATSRVRVVAGGVTRFEGDVRGRLDTTITGLSNDGPTNASLELCNEAGACTTSDQQSVQTYGPLRREHIVAIDPVREGNQVRWNLRVDTNGDPAEVEVRLTAPGRDETQRFTASGVDGWQGTTRTIDAGYDATHRITVTLRDGSPSRGPVTASAETRTPPRPNPTLSISRGDRCLDGTANPCRRQPSDGEACVHASCGRVALTTTNFENAQVTCTISPTVPRTYTAAGNGRTQLTAYYGFPNGRITATCRGANGQSASAEYTWPPN